MAAFHLKWRCSHTALQLKGLIFPPRDVSKLSVNSPIRRKVHNQYWKSGFCDVTRGTDKSSGLMYWLRPSGTTSNFSSFQTYRSSNEAAFLFGGRKQKVKSAAFRNICRYFSDEYERTAETPGGLLLRRFVWWIRSVLFRHVTFVSMRLCVLGLVSFLSLQRLTYPAQKPNAN